jgi:hypothetical protein
MAGVVKQAVGEVIGGAQFAQARDHGGERRCDDRAIVVSCETGAG